MKDNEKFNFNLTSLSNCGGWASKFSQSDLAQVLSQIQEFSNKDPNIITKADRINSALNNVLRDKWKDQN